MKASTVLCLAMPPSQFAGQETAGMCHSAAHARSLGRGMSTVGLARAVGIRVTKRRSMVQQLVKLDKRNKYDSHRKNTKQYRENCYFQRKQKSNRLLYQDSLYIENLQRHH